jgi:hypothetical protein
MAVNQQFVKHLLYFVLRRLGRLLQQVPHFGELALLLQLDERCRLAIKLYPLHAGHGRLLRAD